MPWARAAMTASAGQTGSAVYQTLSGSAVWDQQGGVVRTAPGPSLQRAGISGVVFLDTNANGHQDVDEPGMPGVRLVAGGRLATTDSLGGYHLWDLPAFTTAEVRVDTLSLRDPLWVPALPAFRVLPGADGYREVPVAMVPAGVVEGRVRWEGGAGRTAGIALRLVDRDAGTAQALQTFQDGSFYLFGVRPGRYRLEVGPAALRSIAGMSEPVEFDITAEDALRGVPSVELVLRPVP